MHSVCTYYALTMHSVCTYYALTMLSLTAARAHAHSTHSIQVELMRVLAEPPGFGAAPPQRTLVFCRGVLSACAVQHTMAEAGLNVWGFHSKVRPQSLP